MGGQREGACGIHQPGYIDVVFQEHRDPMQWSAHVARGPLGVQRVGLGERCGIDLDDGVQHRPGVVYPRNAVEV